MGGDGDDDEFAGSMIGFLQGLHRTGVSSGVGIPRNDDLAAHGENVFEPDGFELDPNMMLNAPLFPNGLSEHWVKQLDRVEQLIAGGHSEVSFWKRVFDGLQEGNYQNWELLSEVLTIPDEEWLRGPKHIAGLIEKIEARFELEKSNRTVEAEAATPVSPAVVQAMTTRIAANRDAIVLTASGVLEQISVYREQVRGNNQLDPDDRDRLLSVIDLLTAQLEELLGLFPEQTEVVSEDTGARGVRWLKDFRQALFKNAYDYASPENVAGAAIPTAIILGCTGVASLMGMPVAGTIIGGLITRQLAPGKAVDVLLKPSKSDPGN